MKLRTDFVTNSSSSSFVICKIDSKTFSEIIKKFLAEIEERNPWFDILFDEEVSSEMLIKYEGYLDDAELPTDVLSSVEALLKLLLYKDYPLSKCLSDAKEGDIASDIDFSDFSRSICKEVISKKAEIVEDTIEVNFRYKDVGYGGCSEGIDEVENYTQEQLEEIAKENNVSIEDIDADMLYDCSADKEVVLETTYKYDKEKGLSDSSSKCYIENSDEFEN